MLLERADADIEVAKLLITKPGIAANDDIIMDYAAYHVQQGIEKSLKYLLLTYGNTDVAQKRLKT